MEASHLHNDTPSALPIGTRLGEFELLGLLGVGGFGIVYRAFDHALEREVAVKEYMPASLAGRTETMFVSLRSQSDAETFALGLRSFINEARLLARFDHPSLLKVHRFWEANGTAYMAMPVMRGRTAKEIRLEMVGPPDEAWLRALLEPLLGAIETLHAEGVYHRDIAPDNIQIEPGGHPVLLDFGAARRVISDKSQTLTAILKPAYAPIEQYAEAGAVKQGPWTDIYALGATLHFLLLTRPPAPATTRAVHDEPSALTPHNLPGCSENFLHIVDWMLAPRPTDRPQSVAALRAVLEGRAAPPVRRTVEPAPSQWEATVLLPTGGPTQVPVMPGVTQQPPPPAAPPPVTKAKVVPTQARVPTPAPAPSPSQTPSPALQALFAGPPIAPPAPAPAAGAKKLLPIGIGAGVVAALAATVLLWPRGPVQAPAPDKAASAPTELVVAPPLTASAPLAAASKPESSVATVVVPDTRAPAAPAPTPPAPTPAPTPPATAAVAPAPSLAPTTRPSTTKATPPVARTTPPPKAERPPPVAATRPAPAPESQSPANVYVPPPIPTQAPQPVATAPASPPRQQPSAPAPAPTTAPTAAAAPKPGDGPEARCAGRNVFSHLVCMERECFRGEFATHPDCQRWHQRARRD